MESRVLHCFRPTDLEVLHKTCRIRVPDSFDEFIKITHLDLAHFTSSTVLPGIRKSGILPRQAGAPAIEDGLTTTISDVYLASGVDKFYFTRAVKAHGGFGVAIVVRVPTLMLRADTNMLSPARLEKIDDLRALHLSLIAGACAHSGPVQPELILAVVDETGRPVD